MPAARTAWRRFWDELIRVNAVWAREAKNTIGPFEMGATMRAMDSERSNAALVICDLPVPEAGVAPVWQKVGACGDCSNDLKVLSGALIESGLPPVPGQLIVQPCTGIQTPTRAYQPDRESAAMEDLCTWRQYSAVVPVP